MGRGLPAASNMGRGIDDGTPAASNIGTRGSVDGRGAGYPVAATCSAQVIWGSNPAPGREFGTAAFGPNIG